MIYFTAKIYQVLIFFIAVYCCKANTIEGRLPSFTDLSHFIQQYVKPYIQSLNIVVPNEEQFRPDLTEPVNKAIREKIAELKPFLQDNDVIESDKLTFGDSEETTIIELAQNAKPSKVIERIGNTTSNKLNLYVELRDKIKKYLNKEPVSDKTKKKVLKAVDVLIAQIIGSQCSWKSTDDAQKLAFKMRNPDIGPILKAINLTEKGWEHFKKQYIALNQDEHIADTLLLFNKFQNLFTKIIKDTTKLSKKYKIKCQLVDMEADDPEILREGQNFVPENSDVDDCRHFKLCSEELKAFMGDLYKSVNETAVSAFRNYAAMYVKDVNSDKSDENDFLVSLIYNISNTVEKKTSKIFIKETAKLKLDKAKIKAKNIKNLVQYVKNTIEHVNERLKKNLEKFLEPLRARLLMTVKQDIGVNLDVDLGNLERDFRLQLCTAFVTCNGRYWNRRSKENMKREKHNIDGKSVYVKVQLTLDDEIKDDIVRKRSFFRRLTKSNEVIREMSDKRNIIFSTKLKNIQLTRTTPFDISNLTNTMGRRFEVKFLNNYNIRPGNSTFGI